MKKIIIILLILVMCFCLFSCKNKNEVKIHYAIIYEFLGSNSTGEGITITNNGETQENYIGKRLLKGDIITTDENSQLFIRVDDTKDILLDYNTQMEVTELSGGKLILSLIYGKFFFEVCEELAEDEEMIFTMSNSMMSIRGTSGGGSLVNGIEKYSIYTGKGYVDNNINEAKNENSFILYPCTYTTYSLDENGEYQYQVQMMKEEDTQELLKEYINISEEYKNELIEDGWNIEGDNVSIPETIINEDDNSNKYIGWYEKEEGVWEFSQELYDKGLGPIKYGLTIDGAYPKKVNFVVENVEYNGLDQTANITGFDEFSMKIEGDKQKDAGSYEITISPKIMWDDGTKDSIKLVWTINKKDAVIKVDNQTITFEDNVKYSISGVLEGDTINYSVPSYEHIGTYQLSATVLENKNYNVKSEAGTVKILQKNVEFLSLKNYEGEYDGQYHTITVQTNCKNAPLVYTINNNSFSNPPQYISAGEYVISISLGNTNDYCLNETRTAKITINPSSITARLSAIKYNENTIKFTSNITGNFYENPISIYIQFFENEYHDGIGTLGQMNNGVYYYDYSSFDATLEALVTAEIRFDDNMKRNYSISSCTLTIRDLVEEEFDLNDSDPHMVY